MRCEEEMMYVRKKCMHARIGSCLQSVVPSRWKLFFLCFTHCYHSKGLLHYTCNPVISVCTS